MLIREIQIKDDPVIKQIIQSSLELYDLALPGTAYFDPELGHLSEFYGKKTNAAYWVIEKDGQVLGGCGIAPFDKKAKICELQKIYLAKEAQGQGMARLLMNRALAYAEKYYDFCYLETMKRMEKANYLYQSFGFEKLPEPLAGSEHSVMEVWYLKELQDEK